MRVLYFHELFGSSESAPELFLRSRFESVTMPGHQARAQDATENLTWTAMAEFFSTHFDEPCVLVGRSMGAAVLLHLASSRLWNGNVRGIGVHQLPTFGKHRDEWRARYDKAADFIESHGLQAFVTRGIAKGTLVDSVATTMFSIGDGGVARLFRAAAQSDLELPGKLVCPMFWIAGNYNEQHPVHCAWEILDQLEGDVRKGGRGSFEDWLNNLAVQ